ncbi:uncharacterized protein [Watersipora subatra]|uniref:uncharacterized protein n=1 Tax=Watersipora subatra TaxID=2589382 RepID=UPI00355BE449
MDSGLRRPQQLSFEGNVSKNWRIFEQEYDIYVNAIYNDKPEAARAYMLLNLAGPEAIERERSFTYNEAITEDAEHGIVAVPQETREQVTTLKRKFREICRPITNVILERHRFNARSQKEGEPFQTFLADIRTKAAQCDFGDLQDELLRDRIVSGIRNDNVRKQLLRNSDLTLAKAIQTCQIYESSEQNAAEFSKPIIDVVKRKSYTQHLSNSNTNCSSNHAKSSTRPRTASSHNSSSCHNCGKRHPPKQCPAYGRKCNNCGKLNHYAKLCRSGAKQPGTVDELTESCHEEFRIETVSLPCNNRGDIRTHFTVNDTTLEVKIDTGAKVNVISLNQVRRIGLHSKIDRSRTSTLLGFGGAQSVTVGSVVIPHPQAKLRFEVVDSDARCLLGLSDSIRLGFVTLSQEVFEVEQKPQAPAKLLEDYPELFDGKLGTLPCNYKITIDPEVAPVI